jgi:HD superfamily phosphodiesterase
MLIPNRDIIGLPLVDKYVQDLDLHDAVGTIGVARCLAFSGKINRKFGPPTPSATSKLPAFLV